MPLTVKSDDVTNGTRDVDQHGRLPDSYPVFSIYIWMQELNARSVTEGSARVMGRRKMKGETLLLFLLPITPRASLDRASLVNINERLRDDWERVRVVTSGSRASG